MKIAIYKYTSVPYDGEREGKIYRVQIVPPKKTEEELKKTVNEYNTSQADYIASIVELNEEIGQVIEWCLNDRKLDVQRHVEELERIQDQISDIEYFLNDSVRDIKDSVEKNKPNKI